MNKEMENTINQQLLPCPFCGGKPVIRKSRRFIPARFDKSVIIRCSVCDTKTAGLQLKEAVASWNKRTEKCEEPVEVVSMQPIKQKPEISVNRTDISELGFSKNTYNALRRSKNCCLEDLMGMTEKDLFKIRNLGKKGAEEVLQVCREYGRL